MFRFDRERVKENVGRSSTEDLLARVTAYRAGMEPEAISIIESELCQRGVTQAAIAEKQEELAKRLVFQAEGLAFQCSFCDRPAVVRGWDWHRLWGKIPVFPRIIARCDKHALAAADAIS